MGTAAGEPGTRRHIRLQSRRCSVLLHQCEWELLDEIAARRQTDWRELLRQLGQSRPDDHSLPSWLRLFMLNYWRLGEALRTHRAAGGSELAA